MSAAASDETIQAVAEREGWRVQEIETGLFKIFKLWIDGSLLVELLTKGEVGRYVEAFGASGLSSLDKKLRELEVKLLKCWLKGSDSQNSGDIIATSLAARDPLDL